MKVKKLEEWCLDEADTLLYVRDLEVDEASRLKLARALAAAVQRASLKLARWAKGEFDDPPAHEHASRPSPESRGTGANGKQPTNFEDLFNGWAAEKRPAEKTLYEWRRVIQELEAFLGHGDPQRLTADDLIAWKTAMVESGRSPKTIRDGKLAPIRAILRWAVDNRRLPANPAERISIDVRQKAGEKVRSFMDAEATFIIKAAAKEKDSVLRWIPWLCAYSGARVSEVCQLRAEDVLQLEGIWAMKFDPEAGPLKNRNSERVVPLHPVLIDGGFLDFVSRVESGPLLPSLPPDKFGK